jgi:hypothetical protein
MDNCFGRAAWNRTEMKKYIDLDGDGDKQKAIRSNGLFQIRRIEM